MFKNLWGIETNFRLYFMDKWLDFKLLTGKIAPNTEGSLFKFLKKKQPDKRLAFAIISPVLSTKTISKLT
jgi:hypothetical protein